MMKKKSKQKQVEEYHLHARINAIAAAFLGTVSFSSAASAGSAVLEISCGGTPLTNAMKCSTQETAGSELEIIVNPATQKVQISVTKNAGNYFDLSASILKDCSVVDMQNWVCNDDIRSSPTASMQIELLRKYGMRHGHYYHSLTGGAPPHYYTSSISGWRYLAYRLGILSLKTAEDYD
jgi:hypothetical protein